MTTTSVMTFLDALRWMADRGYRTLMWPCWCMAGCVTPTKNESLEEAIEQFAAGQRRPSGRRYFVTQAPSRGGELNAYVYALPPSLNSADECAVAAEVERLRDGPQWLQNEASDSSWYVYECAGMVLM